MKVLFVCWGNAYRSIVAEALLKKFRPDWRVESAGINPAGFVSDLAKQFLAEENAEKYMKHFPESLEEKRLTEYDIIVVMEEKLRRMAVERCPSCAGKVIAWNIEDPYFLPREHAQRIFEEIKRKVLELVNSVGSF